MKNIFAFPVTTTMTPQQAILSELEFANNDNMQDVLVVGYDAEWCLIVRYSCGYPSNCGSMNFARMPNAGIHRAAEGRPVE